MLLLLFHCYYLRKYILIISRKVYIRNNEVFLFGEKIFISCTNFKGLKKHTFSCYSRTIKKRKRKLDFNEL
jgi:hypothetical protein